MQYTIRNMTETYAIEVLCWKYERPYNFYNQVLTSHAIMELTGNKYYVVFDRYDVLIGFSVLELLLRCLLAIHVVHIKKLV